MKSFLKKNLLLHLWAAAAALWLGLFFLFKRAPSALAFLSEKIVAPFQYFLGKITAPLPFSLAEAGIVLLALLFLFLFIQTVVLLIRRQQRLLLLYRRLMGLIAAILTAYGGFCLLWGVHYYGKSLSDKTGITAAPSSVESLYQTTMIFVEKLNRIEPLVPRSEEMVFAGDIDDIFKRAVKVYDNAGERFPCLKEKNLPAKKFFFSSIMSDFDFTGFFCPFTGEANINVHAPSCYLPSTIAHEMAHQKNIAEEQEANFAAVLACDYCDMPDFQYSGYLLAYVYLNNALFEQDLSLWEKAYAALNDGAKADLAYNARYWEEKEGLVTEVSNTVYESFLQSYDQELGLQSYGAVVDLLIAYYLNAAP